MRIHLLVLGAGLAIFATAPLQNTLAQSAQAWPSGKALADIVRQSKHSVETTMNTDGVAGELSLLRNCYAHLAPNDFGPARARCVSQDIIAYLVEDGQPEDFRKQDMRIDDYLSDHKFSLRMQKYLPPANGSKEQKGRYMTAIIDLAKTV